MSQKRRKYEIECGMVIAAAMCARHGEGVIAGEILNEAGATTLSDMRRIGVEAYDVLALRSVIRHLAPLAKVRLRATTDALQRREVLG